jgi:predicted nuclease with TOPRIM domain
MENIEAFERNKSNTKYFWTAIAILTILTLGLSYLYLQERKLNQIKEAKIEQQIRAQYHASHKIDSIQNEISYKILEINRLGGDVSVLKKIKDELIADKKLVDSKRVTDYKSFEQRIYNYEMVLKKKDDEILQLKKQYGELLSKNENLNTKYESLYTENSGLKTERQQLADSINKVKATNRELSEKVTQASALRAETINVYAINSRGREKDGGNYSARKLEKLRISFHLAENNLTKTEPKEIVMRILDPSGTILADMATGAGVFLHKGQEMIYTLKRTENYTNNHQLVEMIYFRGQDYRPGKYGIELYAEGFKIGTGHFEVR